MSDLFMYRDDVDALTARHEALDAEVAGKTRERDDVAKLLAEARERTRLPVLDNIQIAAPCPADWSAMTGDERVRHCATCDKQVFNLSAMTRDEAEALIVETAGELCGRYYQRADGTILLADCEIGVRRRTRRNKIAAGAFVALAATGSVASKVALTLPAQDEVAFEVEVDPEDVVITERESARNASEEDDVWVAAGAISFSSPADRLRVAIYELAALDEHHKTDREKLDAAYASDRASLMAERAAARAVAIARAKFEAAERAVAQRTDRTSSGNGTDPASSPPPTKRSR